MGEKIAASYLRDIGWTNIQRNVLVGGYELDIVGRDPDGLLVVVEVKFSEHGLPGFTGEVRLNHRKIAALRRGLEMFVAKHHRDTVAGCRLDAICVTPKKGELTNNTNDYIINHYINVLG